MDANERQSTRCEGFTGVVFYFSNVSACARRSIGKAGRYMRLLALVGALALCVNAHGQGTFELAGQLTSPLSILRGQGTFTLTESLLTYDVTAPWRLDVCEIRGPGPFPEAPLLFNLRLLFCNAPGPPPDTNRVGCFFQGSLALSDLQVQQLLEGQWYARVFVEERVSLQGQIVLVPEPSPFILLALGLGILIAVRHLLLRRSALSG